MNHHKSIIQTQSTWKQPQKSSTDKKTRLQSDKNIQRIIMTRSYTATFSQTSNLSWYQNYTFHSLIFIVTRWIGIPGADVKILHLAQLQSMIVVCRYVNINLCMAADQADFPHSAFYTSFRSFFPHLPFRILFSAFRISAFYWYPTKWD